MKEKGENNKPEWWSIKFYIQWKQDENPIVHMDLLLANEIIYPILEKREKDLILWRFHRRWNRNKNDKEIFLLSVCLSVVQCFLKPLTPPVLQLQS